MVLACYKSEAPGSVILMGEYAVLHGYPAIVAAINKKIRIQLKPNNNATLIIHSELGKLNTSIKNLKIVKPFEYVLTTLLHCKIEEGCEIEIQSEFSSKMGLGSSAAVTVALLIAIYQWQQKPLDLCRLFSDALKIIHQVQGQGSGADIAASIYGGIIEYRAKPFKVTPLTCLLPLVVIFSGSKTTTTSALKTLRERQQQEPDYYQNIFHALGEAANKSRELIQNRDWVTLGKLMNEAQINLQKLGVSTPNIEKIIQALKQQSSIYGAKISGAGLGDCVIGLGYLNKPIVWDDKIETLAIQIGIEGVSHVH